MAFADLDWIQDLSQDAYDAAVAVFLHGNLTPAGTLLHWSDIIAKGLYYGKRKFGSLEKLPTFTGAGMAALKEAVPKAMADLMNDIYSTLQDPNVEGIPISASSEAVTREVDVSVKPILVPNLSTRSYATDNAVPKPRTWTVKGYLASLWNIDAGFVLKPSLKYQVNMLDAFARSRRPVWYKTSDCEFVKVLISALQIESQATSSTTKAIIMQLTEFIPLNITSGPTGIFTARKV